MAIIINVVGEGSNVGKTELVVGLVKEIKMRNFTVSTIKHHGHTKSFDTKGKDTYKHMEAGADSTILVSEEQTAVFINEEKNLYKLIEFLDDKDFIIVEGYKNCDLPKIEVWRSGVSQKIITDDKNLICIVADNSFIYGNKKVILRDNYREILDFVIKRYRKEVIPYERSQC